MSYHIFLTKLDNFRVCLQRGIYGGICLTGSPKSEQINADIIAGFAGIKTGDFLFLYVKNIGLYGLWKVTVSPFYDVEPLWNDPKQTFPYRICFEPAVREFRNPITLSDILDLKDKGKIWTFDLAAFTKKSHHPITTDEGKELIRLLLRNNPIYAPTKPILNPYQSARTQPLPIRLDSDKKGRLIYEGYLNAWFMEAFANGRLKELIGDYSDYINYVPTSFNKIMDIFLTHVTNVDGVNILHKFTCMELKTSTVTEEDLNQIIMYENWLIRKIAQGDSQMVQSILVGFEFDERVLGYRDKRRAIEEKTVRLIKYVVDEQKHEITFAEE
ncbi:MAG: EVE domain-containing protein [Dehalococcoidia bacterium]|nr:EVE domain-containing protein [Dehalococcoidia bacterium]